MQKLFITTSFLLVFGLFGQVHAEDSESQWTELTIEEFEELILGNTLKGRSSRDRMHYVEYYKEKGRKIVGRSETGEYSTRWKPGDDNCIMYRSLGTYQCWKVIRNEDGDLKWKRGYGFEDELDVTVLEGKQLSNKALYAGD